MTRNFLSVFGIALLLGASLPAPAQTYRLAWKSDVPTDPSEGSFGNAVVLDRAGLPITIGSVTLREGGSSRRVLMARKFSPDGQVIWESQFDPSQKKYKNNAYGAVLGTGGQIWVSSGSPTPNTERFYISQLDPNSGRMLSSVFANTALEQASPTALAATPDGGVVQVGGIGPTGRERMFVVKWSAAGTEQWRREMRGNARGDAQALCVAVSPRGEIAVGGYVTNEGQGQDLALAVYSPAGQPLAEISKPGQPGFGTDRITAVAFNPDGDLFVTGEAYVEGSVNYLYAATLKAPFNQLTAEFVLNQPRSTAGAPRAMVIVGRSAVIASAFSGSGNERMDLGIIDYPRGPGPIVRNMVPGVPNSDEEARGVTSDRYQNTYAVASSVVSGSPATFLIARFNGDRTLAWSHREPGLTVGLFTPTGVAVDSFTGNVYVVGSPNGSRDNRYMLYCFYQAPTSTTDSYRTTKNERLTVSVAQGVMANDQFAPRGTVSLLQGPEKGQVELAADGSFAFTPASDFVGTATFRYRLTRPDLSVSDAAVRINVVEPDKDQFPVN
jgi:hypothetical protein